MVSSILPQNQQKNRLYYYFTSSRIVSVHFLGELKTSKRLFEINWPLTKLLYKGNISFCIQLIKNEPPVFAQHWRLCLRKYIANNVKCRSSDIFKRWSHISKLLACKKSGNNKNSSTKWPIYLGYSLPPPRIGLTFFIC